MFSLLSTILFFVLTVSDVICTSRPIIGIVVRETTDVQNKNYPGHFSQINSQYVKAIESSAARVVPLALNQPESYYRDLLYSLNGVVLPAGTPIVEPVTAYYKTVAIVYKIAKKINDDGSVFPILAVNLGMEILMTIANNENNILKQCDVLEKNLPLIFRKDIDSSKLFEDLSSDQREILENEDVTANQHKWCVLVGDFENSYLPNDWRITSTSISNGVEFIATVEGKRYPFFAIQFHPEKVAFEWFQRDNGEELFPYSLKALKANRHFYDVFVSYARKNNHKFTDAEKEHESLIYNYPPTYTARNTRAMQVYFDLPAEMNHSSDCVDEYCIAQF